MYLTPQLLEFFMRDALQPTDDSDSDWAERDHSSSESPMTFERSPSPEPPMEISPVPPPEEIEEMLGRSSPGQEDTLCRDEVEQGAWREWIHDLSD